MAQSAAAEPGVAGRTLEAAHQALKAREDLQFQFEDAVMRIARPTPGWMRRFFDWLTGLFQIPANLIQLLFWAALIAVALAILYVAARELGALDWTRRKARPAPAAPLYRPDAAVARALLADADALAAQGRFEEAVHVLLLRSVEDMGRWRPRSVEPSFTSRDLSALPVLPPPARDAFSAMARLVETSLFGGRPVGEEGFRKSREAYAAFALPGIWA